MTDSCADYGGDAAFGAAAIDGAGASDVDEDGTADSGSGCDDGAGASVLTMVVVFCLGLVRSLWKSLGGKFAMMAALACWCRCAVSH